MTSARRAGVASVAGRALRSMGRADASGPALVSPQPITFLGFVDRRTGVVGQKGHPLRGESLAGRVLVFPRGVGSTVGPYILLEMAENGVAPRAIVMHRGDLGTIAAASLARLPLVYDSIPDPCAVFSTGEVVTVTIAGGRGKATRSKG